MAEPARSVRDAARRVLAGSRNRPVEGQDPVEYGQPGVADAEYARVHREWTNQRRRETRRVLRRRWPAGAITTVALTVLLWSTTMGRLVLIAGSVAIGTAVMAWPLRDRMGSALPPVVAAWAGWRSGRRLMADALREGLDGRWHLGWDRLIPGWERPVTVAVGPSGIWALWAAEPGYKPDTNGLAAAVRDALGAPGELVWSWTAPAGQGWEKRGGCQGLLTTMVVGQTKLSPAQIRQWSTAVAERTMAEPLAPPKS